MIGWRTGFGDNQPLAPIDRRSDRIKRYCRVHRDETIWKAGETVLGTGQ